MKVLSRRSLFALGLALVPSASAARGRAPRVRVLARLLEAGRLPFGCGYMVASSVARFQVLAVLEGSLQAPEIWVGFFCSAIDARAVGASFELTLERSLRSSPGHIAWPRRRGGAPLLWSVARPRPR